MMSAYSQTRRYSVPGQILFTLPVLLPAGTADNNSSHNQQHCCTEGYEGDHAALVEE
jgi:hypothetical protein